MIRIPKDRRAEVEESRARLEAWRDTFQYFPILPEEQPIVETPESVWTKRQWYILNQLRADNANLREKWYKHLKEDREYRAKKNEEVYTII